MSAGKYNITIEQGSTFNLDLIYKDSAGVQQDLSGSYTARMQIRDSPEGDIIDSSNSSPGNIVLGHMDNQSTPVFQTGAGNLGNASATATIRVSIPANITATYDFDTAFYDLELVSGSTTVERVIEGTVKLSREITK